MRGQQNGPKLRTELKCLRASVMSLQTYLKTHLVRLLRGIHLQVADSRLCPSGPTIASASSQSQCDVNAAAGHYSQIVEG